MFNCEKKFAQIEGFAYAEQVALLEFFKGRVGAHKDCWHVSKYFNGMQAVIEVQAIDAWEIVVEEKKVRERVFDYLKGFQSVDSQERAIGDAAIETLLLHGFQEKCAQVFVVFNNQNGFFFVRLAGHECLHRWCLRFLIAYQFLH